MGNDPADRTAPRAMRRRRVERNLRSFASRGSVALGDGRWAARRDGYTNLRRLSPQQGPTTAGPAQADLGNSDELAGTRPEPTQEPSPPITKAPLAVAPICHPEGQVGHVGIQPSQRGAGRVVINGNGEREWPWAILTLPTRRFGRMAGGRKASGRVATFRSNRFRPLQPFWGGLFEQGNRIKSGQVCRKSGTLRHPERRTRRSLPPWPRF